MNRVLTVGVFDLLHFGHFELFRRAKELASKDGELTVAVHEGAIVTKYKPDAKLVHDWDTRVKMIDALRHIKSAYGLACDGGNSQHGKRPVEKKSALRMKRVQLLRGFK